MKRIARAAGLHKVGAAAEAPKRPRGTVINVTIGLALLINTGGLVYALIH
jgi:hypothetical protein